MLYKIDHWVAADSQLRLTSSKLVFLDYRELKKLSEESLTRQPEEVFDILCKLGEGSYGSVYKALHKESRQVLAIKQVRQHLLFRGILTASVFIWFLSQCGQMTGLFGQIQQSCQIA